jgi:O-methyltransferase
MTLQKTAKSSFKRIATSPLLGPVGRPLLRAVQYVLSLHHREVVSYDQPERVSAMKRVREILAGWPTQVMSADEAYMIRGAVLSTTKIEGDLAEVGVFRGTSAKVICEAKGDRPLHLFDTFEGLPPTSRFDSGFQAGQYACSLDAVRDYLKDFPNVQFYKGYFPMTGEPVQSRGFSFVHLDVDLFESTVAALEFFYPRMNPGAILISHDYVAFAGVRKAFDEFFEHKSEPVIELSGNQCLVVKVTPQSSDL